MLQSMALQRVRLDLATEQQEVKKASSLEGKQNEACLPSPWPTTSAHKENRPKDFKSVKHVTYQVSNGGADSSKLLNLRTRDQHRDNLGVSRDDSGGTESSQSLF